MEETVKGNAAAEGKEKRSIFSKIKKIKNIEIIIAAVAVLAMILIYFSTSLGGKKQNTSTPTTTFYSDYCAKMEKEVNDIVCSISGAGAGKTLINWESSVELLIAQTESASSGSSSSSPYVINSSGATSPIILKEIYPKALGVVVICEGGGNAGVKVNIMMALSTLLKIETDRIVVLPMSKK